MRFILLLVLLMASEAAYAAWYEGGTLQKATVSDWQAATPENQLATAGDFIASMNGITDLATVTNPDDATNVRKKAEDLVVCLNQSITASMPPDRPIAEIVVLCTIMKPK